MTESLPVNQPNAGEANEEKASKPEVPYTAKDRLVGVVMALVLVGLCVAMMVWAGGTPQAIVSKGATAETLLRLSRATPSTVASDWYSAQRTTHGPALGG